MRPSGGGIGTRCCAGFGMSGVLSHWSKAGTFYANCWLASWLATKASNLC